MSSTKLKTKAKNAQNTLKFSKVFLANPIKPKIPSLEEVDFGKLQELLIDAVKKSNLNGRTFATEKNISIGLESTLRAIKNCKAGCVFLSANIKPKYLLGLIARNVETKDEQVSTFVQSQLEDVSQNIFNIRALALVLPKNCKNLSEEIQLWIETHKKHKNLRSPSTTKASGKKLKTKNITITVNSPCAKPKALPKESEPKENIQTQPWGNDYISFSNKAHMNIDEDNTDGDSEKLLDALGQMVTKAKQYASIEPDAKPKTTANLPAPNLSLKKHQQEENSDEDDFLCNYSPLVVHKICANPNRKLKTKTTKKHKKLKDKVKGTKNKFNVSTKAKDKKAV